MTTGEGAPRPKDDDRDVRIGVRLMTAVGVAILLALIGLRAYQGLRDFQQMMVGWCEWSGGSGQPVLPGASSDCGTWAGQVMLAHPQIVVECTASIVNIQSFYNCMDQNAGALH